MEIFINVIRTRAQWGLETADRPPRRERERVQIPKAICLRNFLVQSFTSHSKQEPEKVEQTLFSFYFMFDTPSTPSDRDKNNIARDQLPDGSTGVCRGILGVLRTVLTRNKGAELILNDNGDDSGSGGTMTKVRTKRG